MDAWSNKWYESWRGLTSNQPWQTALEDWWRQMSDQSATQPPQAFEKIASQSRAFFQLAEQFGDLLRASDLSTDWQANLENMFANLKQQFAGPDRYSNASFWQTPMASWQKAMASLGPEPSEWSTEVDRLFSVPGVGYTREYQEESQRLAKLVVDYQQASGRYYEIFTQMNQKSLDLMRDRLLARMAEGDEPITSVKELYKVWVDCSEEVYGNEALTDDYTRRYGEMINALMALKQQQARMVDDFAESMNMPTRAEMETLHQRFQSSRRAERSLADQVKALQAQVAELRGIVDGRTGVAAKPRKKRTVKKTTPGKKASSSKKVTSSKKAAASKKATSSKKTKAKPAAKSARAKIGRKAKSA